MDELAALVEQLALFCRGHLDGNGAAAAGDLRSWLESAWTDIPKTTLPFEPEQRLDAETLVLNIVRDVGELAGMLLQTDDPDRALAWARANLIDEVERYRDRLTGDRQPQSSARRSA